MGEGILDMKLFHLAVKLGSISRAGNVMNISRTAASKRVAILESKFGGDLLIRNKDGIQLTVRGKIFLLRWSSSFKITKTYIRNWIHL